MNLPNRLTCLRILLAFVFMFCLFLKGAASKYIALSIFLIASATDFYDGFIARKTNQVTDFGKLMDPIADKILVLSAFLAFVELKLIPAWMVVLIITRELLITGLRLFAMTKSCVLSSDYGGRHKTVSQMVSIIFILGYLCLKETAIRYATFWSSHIEALFKSGIFLLMLLTVGLTLTSGISYLWNNSELFRGTKQKAILD